MDDSTHRASLWLQETESPSANPWRDGAGLFAARIEAIDDGLRLRRRLDRFTGETPEAACRLAVAERLTWIEEQVDQHAFTQETEREERSLLANRVRGWLGEAKAAVRALAGNSALDPLAAALALEGLRGDLEWFSRIIARLDREPAHPAAMGIELELDRASSLLEQARLRSAQARLAPLKARSQELAADLLERKITLELAIEPLDPLGAWRTRFQLTRLAAEAAALGVERFSSDSITARLAARCDALVDDADARLAALDAQSRTRMAERIVQAGVDELVETTAFIEDLPAAHAAERLERLQVDLARLLESCRRAAGQARAAAHTDRQAVPERLQRVVRRARRLKKRARAAWREKTLAARLEHLLGRRAAQGLDAAVLLLIVILCGLIALDFVLTHARTGGLSAAEHRWLGAADLVLSSFFLLEFTFKLILTPDRFAFLVDHMLVDLAASLPFGFVSHAIELAALETGAIAAGRWARLLRYLRVLVPVARLARAGLVLLRLADRTIGRLAGLLNRNIVLFEPMQAQRPESRDRHRLRSVRAELEAALAALEPRLVLNDRVAVLGRILGDLQARANVLQPVSAPEELELPVHREIPIEAVVERLIQMTPEQLRARAGPGFIAAADRYLRLLNLPGIRRLPWVRDLLAYRERSPAEAVSLAANQAGLVIQRGLDLVYFMADLQGTLSPPVFLDRLGSAIVSATRTPAKRLLWLGGGFLFVFLVVQIATFLRPLRGFVDRIQIVIGWPVIILGAVCLGLWALGSWLRKIANQSADYCERVVEAQFAAHTRSLKSRRREQDARFLADRVIDPELLLRASDDRIPDSIQSAGNGNATPHVHFVFENRELAFLRNVRLLYQDYLEGSPLHRSDVKATVQLLGNLALGNLRRSHLGHLLEESRMLDRLDLSRAGGIFGGPYLWFNYITRLLVQETAILILDYNRNAIPCDRLACSPEPVRARYRAWLASRLRIDPVAVLLPDPAVANPAANVPAGDLPATAALREEAELFLETVEFTAVDFLADDPVRCAEIASRFGPQVAELVARDREQNVRRAFRSFPLHELPLSSRTLNPFALYQTHIAGGRVLLLPLTCARLLLQGSVAAARGLSRVIREILDPHVDRQQPIPADTYWAALRKIHRMRKPIFMGSLWLRARFDVEYVGLSLPTAPESLAPAAFMETDLDYIRATRRDRILAEQARRRHKARLDLIRGWLVRFGFTFDGLGPYLLAEIPYLANRGGEALRALTAACILDHDDIATLASSIEGLSRVMAWAANRKNDRRSLPPALPDPVLNPRRLWRPVHRVSVSYEKLFALECFPRLDDTERGRARRYLERHRRVVRGWIKVVLGQGGPDPWAVVKSRMHQVLLRTDLWSDQILVLRALQTLTMLDIQHNCELVWSLGGYSHEPDDVDAELPKAPPTSERGVLKQGSHANA